MKTLSILLIGLFALSLTACGGTANQKKPESEAVKLEPLVKKVEGIPTPAVSAFNEGVKHMRETPPNYTDALTAFSKAASLYPKYRIARVNSAICLEKTGQYRKAADIYEALIADYVEDPSVYMAYGNALLLIKESDKAIAQFEKVVSLDDTNLEAKNNLAAAYLRMGQVDRSLEFVKEVLAIDPENVPALINLGLYYRKNKNMELAKLMLTNALGYENAKGKPIAAPVEDKKLAKQGKKGDKKGASAKKAAPKVKPGTPNPLLLARAENNLGLVWYEIGVMPTAVYHFKRAVKYDASMNEARMNLASIYLDYLAYENALKEFQTVLKSNPNHYAALIGTADTLYGTGKYKEAAGLFEKSFSMSDDRAKKNVEAMNRLAKLYHKKLNDADKAMATYARVQTDLGLTAKDKAYKKAGQMIKNIKMEIEAAKTFAEEDRKAKEEAEKQAAAAKKAAEAKKTGEAEGAEGAEKTESTEALPETTDDAPAPTEGEPTEPETPKSDTPSTEVPDSETPETN